MIEDVRSVGSLLAARTWLYELFHRITGGEPTAELLEVLASPVMLDALDEYASESQEIDAFARRCRELACLSGEAQVLDRLDDLRSEYNRLLTGMGGMGIALWQSAHEGDEPSYFGRQTLRVRSKFAEHGLRVKRSGSIPDDGVALMTGFLSRLSREDFALYIIGDTCELVDRLAEEALFVSEHLSNWVGEAVRAAASGEEGTCVLALRAMAEFFNLDAAFAANAREWMCEMDAENSNVADALTAEDVALFEAIMRERDKLVALHMPFSEDAELVAV